LNGVAANLSISFRDVNFSSVGGNQVSTTSSSWTLLSTSSTAPAGAVYATFEIFAGTNGQVEFDELYARYVRNLDNEVADGTTYGRPLASRLSSGKPLIDFAEGIHLNKNIDNVADGTNYARPLATRINAGRPTIDFSEAIHANKNIDNVADGSTRLAAVAATTSYRPLSNPLTATDAGSSATVSVAAFTMRVAGKGDIAVSSGSVSALSYSTVYYIYYDDPSFSGGSVTFSATTTKENALSNSGRFFVGSILTPSSGGSTVGNNDGGTGVQSGIISSAYPTSFSGTFDTSSSVGGIGLSTPGVPETETWSGIIPAANDGAAYSKVLSISSSVTFTSATGTATLKYSTNGGNSYTTIYTANASRAGTTDTVILPAGQDLTQVRIQASVNCSSGTKIQQNISMIRITETS
jgi:hypothetical protein